MTVQFLPPPPPVTPNGFADPGWQRWLAILRARVVQAIMVLQIATKNGFEGTVNVDAVGVATITLGTTVSGIPKGVAGAFVAAVPGVDFVRTLQVTAPILNSGTAADPNIAHAMSGVTVGTYTKVTVDTFGHVTVGTALTSGDVTGALGYTPLNPVNNLSELTSKPTARTNLGLGTIATQSASAVAITGGTIDGTAIGETTPAAGAFTTLSSQMSKVDAVNTSGQAIPNNSSTATTNWTVVSQVGTAFNAATGVYTVPATGWYIITFQLEMNLTSPPVGTTLLAIIQVAGSDRQNGVTVLSSTAQTKAAVQVTAIMNLTSGQTLTLNAYQNSGSSATLDIGTANVYMGIAQLA